MEADDIKVEEFLILTLNNKKKQDQVSGNVMLTFYKINISKRILQYFGIN